MDELVIRLNHLPAVVLVKVQKSKTAYRAYWSGNRLGTVGQMRAKKLWGWKAADGSAKGEGLPSRGAAVVSLWQYHEDAGLMTSEAGRRAVDRRVKVDEEGE